MSEIKDVVRANAFELIDPNGRTAARLEYNQGPNGGPSLSFFGRDAARLVVALEGEKPLFQLNSHSGRTVATLVAHEDDKRVFLRICQRDQTANVCVGVGAEGKPFLEMHDKSGNLIAKMPAEPPPAN